MALGIELPLVAASLAGTATGPLVVVLAHGDDIEAFCQDMALFSEVPVDTFPPNESGPRDRVLDDENFGQRLKLLKRLLEDRPPRVVVTSIQAIQQPVPRRAAVREQTRRLEQGAEVDVPALLTWLVEHGFHATSAVELPGELSHRGGILDLFAPDWNEPVRIEFFGDAIESIRRFEVASQRSLDTLQSVEVTALPPSAEDREHFANYLPAKSWFALIEPTDIEEEEGRHFLERLENPADAHSVRTTLTEVYRFPSVTLSGIRRLARNDVSLADRIGRTFQRRHRQGARRARCRQRRARGLHRLAHRGRNGVASKSLASRGWPRRAGSIFAREVCGRRLPARAAAHRPGQRRRAVPSHRVAPFGAANWAG